MKTGLILLTALLGTSALAQTATDRTTNPAPANVQTNKPAATAPAVAAGKPAKADNAASPQLTAPSKTEPTTTGTNTPPAYPDAQAAPDTGWESLQGFDRSLEPRATSRKRVDTTDQTGRVHGVSVDGVIIKAVTMDNPLQLINPFAPTEYGWGTDTLVPGVARHTDGIAFFSLRF